MFSYLQALQLNCVIFFHIIELFLKVTWLNAKILHNSVEFQHLNMLYVPTATYISLSELTVSTYTYSCRLILVPACEGRHTRCILRVATLFCVVCLFFLLCVHILCALYSTNYVVPCVCVPPAVSFLCMSAFFRSLHTSNKLWAAYTLLCIFLFAYLWIYVLDNTHLHLWKFFL